MTRLSQNIICDILRQIVKKAKDFSVTVTLFLLLLVCSVSARGEISQRTDQSEIKVSDRLFTQIDTIRKLNSDEYIEALGKDNFKGGRTARWYYAWVIYKEYPWYKKIFGGGFDYLSLFGNNFGEVEFDYHHNTFISAFLFSVLIGGIIYIIFMVLVF